MKTQGTMKALIFRGPNDIRLETRAIPSAGFGEAVVRVTLTTICGTDVQTPRCRKLRERFGRRSSRSENLRSPKDPQPGQLRRMAECLDPFLQRFHQ